MNKKSILIVFFGMFLFGICGVIAEGEGNMSQNLFVNIGNVYNLNVLPLPIVIQNSLPGSNDNPAINGPIKFNANGSNVDFTVTVSSVSGYLFNSKLEFDGVHNALHPTFNMVCNLQPDSTCSYNYVTSAPTLDVPLGFCAGNRSGVITYSYPNNNTKTQDVTVFVDHKIILDITPKTVDFNSPLPGTFNNPSTNGSIKFNANGSNVNVISIVTDVAGKPFDTGLKLDGNNPINQSFTVNCAKTNNPETGYCKCDYNIISTVPTLDIPDKFKAGVSLGTITYTVSGETPL